MTGTTVTYSDLSLPFVIHLGWMIFSFLSIFQPVNLGVNEKEEKKDTDLCHKASEC